MPGTYRRCIKWLTVVLTTSTLLIFPIVVRGHGEGPPPTPTGTPIPTKGTPMSPKGTPLVPTVTPSPTPGYPKTKWIPGGTTPPTTAPAPVHYVRPVRWSWIHWWEANRDVYLEVVRQDRGQKNDPQVVDKFRQQALTALFEATKHPSPNVRAAAALSLGQMGEESALDTLVKLADDKDPVVMRNALVALGLLNVPKAEDFLSKQLAIPARCEAAICGLGLMSGNSADVIGALQNLAAVDKPELAAMAGWALSHRKDAKFERFVGEVIAKNPNPWVVSEAIVSSGRLRPDRSLEFLSKFLVDGDGPCMAYSRLESINKSLQADRGGAGMPGFGQQVMIGCEMIYMCRLRASAAIALASYDPAKASPPLIRCLSDHNDDFTDLYKEMAIISLGQLGDPSAADVLGQILVKGRTDDNAPKPDSPLRGFAALALGLYARPMQTAQGPADRPKWDKACELLAVRMADPNDELEVRAACALALGLTGRTENLRYLQAASKTIPGDGEALIGFALLGRGMLGDKNILEPARRYLGAATKEKDSMSEVLGQRAAILGLGLSGTEEAIPVLLSSWHLSYYPNREAPFALSLAGAYNTVDPLIKLMKESDNPWERVFAARSLGELFCRSRPQRLAWLTNGNNYMLKNNTLQPYRALANEFLFQSLIPAFGSQFK